MSDKPKAIRFTTEEGGEWIAFEYRGSRLKAHSIMFDDGSVFDMVSGWRPFQYCPCCGARRAAGTHD